MSPKFQVKITEAVSRHIMEREKRYSVRLNDAPVGELYYNMTGYRGALPTIMGYSMDIGERGISAYRKEAAIINREAAHVIKEAQDDPRKIVMTRPTDDSGIVLGISSDGEERQARILDRATLRLAEQIFGENAEIGLDFFREEMDLADYTVQLFPGDEALLAEFPDMPARMLDPGEMEMHARYVDEVVPTAIESTVLLISRRAVDDADPEPHFVERYSYEMQKALHGDALRVADIKPAAEARIDHPESRAALKAVFPWLSRDGEPDAGKYGARVHEVHETWLARKEPLDDDERAQIIAASVCDDSPSP